MMRKEQVKAFWKVCVDDSEEFVEMYFGLRYKTEVHVAIPRGDEVISALQMLPYPMTFGGETVPTSYISVSYTHLDVYKRQQYHRYEYPSSSLPMESSPS